MSAALAAARRLPKPDPTFVSISDESVWVQESFQAAQDAVYVDPISVGEGPFTLAATYKGNAKRLAAQRVALASARLANLLNSELK